MAVSFSLSQFLPYRLSVVSERISRRLSVSYGTSHGLSVAEWRVLVHLQYCGAVSVRDIQLYTNLEKSRVSRAVSRLDHAGMVQKQTSKSDARLIEIALTKAGRNVLADVLTSAIATEKRLLKEVSDADLSTFFRVIEHFHTVLDEDAEAQARPRLDPNP